MSNQGRAGSSAGSWLLIGGIGVVLSIAAGTLLLFQGDDLPSDAEVSGLVTPAPTPAPAPAPAPTPAPTPTPTEVPAPTPSDDADATADAGDDEVVPKDAPEVAETEAPDDEAPSIDEVRLDQDGVAVVAGRAEPGAQVDVIVDGEVVASTAADSTGSFAAIGVVEPSDQARVLSLSAGEDEEAVVSKDEVIIAPIPAAPLALAQEQAEDTTGNVVASEAEEGVLTIEKIGEAFSEEAPEQEPETETEQSEPAAPEQEQENEIARSEPAAPAQADTSDTSDAPARTEPESEGENVVVEAPQPQAQPEVAEVAPAAEPEAAPQIALLKSTEEGVELLGTAPTPPRQIQLDTIGYSDGGVVQLAGRASVEAVEVRVYLNNRSIARLPVDSTGSWRGDLPGVDAGVYTLRVDALDEGGSVTSRLETPFKREAPEVLAAATSGSLGPVSAVTVQTGDTLWAIARDRYGEGVLYVRVFEANRASIRDPDLIYPGQVFDLPDN